MSPVATAVIAFALIVTCTIAGTLVRAKMPERAADAGALQVALEMELAQVEAVADKRVRTREVVKGILG